MSAPSPRKSLPRSRARIPWRRSRFFCLRSYSSAVPSRRAAMRFSFSRDLDFSGPASRWWRLWCNDFPGCGIMNFDVERAVTVFWWDRMMCSARPAMRLRMVTSLPAATATMDELRGRRSSTTSGNLKIMVARLLAACRVSHTRTDWS
ncbi:hypothetical protein KC362_g34 [Hortaea werneckii]|nr:hypothetical protein KC362_g34 [Hortaea werneckii]